MGQRMKLKEVIQRLPDFDANDTIYVSEPWNANSAAIVATEPKAGGAPVEALEAGMKYFIEIDIAKNFIEEYISSLNTNITQSDICERLIMYVVNDA